MQSVMSSSNPICRMKITYSADSGQVEQGSDDRYSPQEVDCHWEEPTVKKSQGN